MDNNDKCNHIRTGTWRHCQRCFELLDKDATELQQQPDYKSAFDALFGHLAILVHHQNNAADGRAGLKNKALGVQKGIPDFQIIGPNGATFFVEVKTETGRLSKDQKAMIARLRSMWHTVHVSHSLQYFIEICKIHLKQ